MAVIKDAKSGFDFAYKGYQYPLPPSWKYTIRQQDQINWLLQAILKLNDDGISNDELNEAINMAIDYSAKNTAALQSELDALKKGWFTARNPVTGMYDFGYVILKQMYDILRVYACTWDELAETGMTWDELKAEGHSWFEVDTFGNLYWGDGSIRVKYTPRDHIDWLTPGYDYSCWPWPLNPEDNPVDPEPEPEPEPKPEPEPEPGVNATTWDSLKFYGFIGTDGLRKTSWNQLSQGFRYYTGQGEETADGSTWDDIKLHGFAVEGV